MIKQLVFLCGARDFHAMDWYKSAKELMPDKEVFILTDLIAGEGFKKLINENDIVFNLIILDRFLLNTQSKIGNIWRNFIKLLVFPFQVVLIKRFSKKYPHAIFHAHSMYYLFLAWAAKISYVGTPQGSDVLIKPYKSVLYKYFSVKSLKAAKAITVDSVKMKEKIFELSGVNAQIIQNGIDLDSIKHFLSSQSEVSLNRSSLLSIRGFAPLYRIKELVLNRNSSMPNLPITFIYPFYENEYKKEVNLLLNSEDQDMGRVDRSVMYKILATTKLVFSIPFSDSSPRSVYEAIFCGSAVAITYHPYYDNLPDCMKNRIILVDLNDKNWFEKSVNKANQIVNTPYFPSEEAVNLFDQKKSFIKLEKLFFN